MLMREPRFYRPRAVPVQRLMQNKILCIKKAVEGKRSRGFVSRTSLQGFQLAKVRKLKSLKEGFEPSTFYVYKVLRLSNNK